MDREEMKPIVVLKLPANPNRGLKREMGLTTA